MNLQGYATTTNPTSNVISAYSSAPYQSEPVASDAPWVIIGSFRVPEAVTARLEALGLNTGPAVLSLAIYNPTQMAASVTAIVLPTEGLTRSNPVDFLPNITYQVAVRYLGASGIGLIRTVSLGAL